MIPQKLQLRNFMSYRDELPVLDFAGIHVACLSGENGAGKSALLDAITWALWGKARVSSDDELISQGEEEMEVDFEFSLNDGLYRVLRRRSSAKRGQTVLDLQIAETGTWRSISGNTIRETQTLINDVLRMQYETFINSAFLVQGKADEFTRKTPAERKQVLSEILGLDEYERLEARAKDHVRDLNDQVQGKEALIADYRQQVARRDFLIDMERAARERVDTHSNEVEQAQQQFDAAQARRRELEAQRDERDQHQGRLQALQHDLAEAQTEHAVLMRDIEVARQVVARQAEIEQGFAQLSAARAELTRLDGLYEQAIVIRDLKRDQQSAIDLLEQQLHGRLTQLQADMQRHQVQIDQQVRVQTDLAAAQQRLASFVALAAELQTARQQREQLETQHQHLSQLLVRQQQLLGLISVAKDSLIAAREEQNRRVMEYDSVLRNEERWREEFATATAQQRTLQRDERRLAELRTQDQGAAQRLGELQARTETFKTQGDQINEKLTILEHGGDTTCPLCQSEIGHTGIDQIRQQYLDERTQLRDLYRDTDTESKALARDIDSRRREMYGLERKVEELKTITAKVARLENDLRDAEEQHKRRAEAEATMLDLQGRLESEDYAHKERAELAEVERDITVLGLSEIDLAQQRKSVAASIERLEGELGERGSIEAQVAVLEQQLQAIKEAGKALAAVTDQALSLQVQIDRGDFAHEQRQEIGRLQQQMIELGYGRNAHAEVREQVAALEIWAEQAQLLRDALHHLATNERHATRLQQLIERTKADTAQLEATLTTLNQQILELPAVARKADEARQSLERSRRTLAVAQQDLGAAQEKVEQVQQIAAQLEAQEQLLTELLDQRSLYQELVQAFGKKGIQAMLIETAIPELEREANDLLGRMTDNQMHVRFETMRATKKGDTSETLDIHIADEQGTRRYDLYSGGEAFRINFAIRIALSKMLARRAGASLQTLIIDEGFGSQDGRGRERIVEAINHIQDEFERIIVITHIQELKDQFPIQIEITKTPAGSRWALN